ncbi:non-ribosomal peptide synthetase [Streptomyces mirabilis]
MHHLVAAQADRTPGRIAVRCGTTALTYRELLDTAGTVAGRLERRGIGFGHRVAVSVDRSTDLVVALLGVLLAGAAFVPVDPTYPAERQAYMLRDAGARLTLTVGRLAGRATTGDVLLLDAPDPGAKPNADVAGRNAADAAGSGDLAYLMYTSGSTGRPKAVMVDHHCLVKGVLAMAPVVAPEPEDVWVSVTSASFDPILVDLFLPLASGGSVVIAEERQVLDGRELGRLLDGCGATVLQATPLAWSMLLDAGWRGRLRVALCGGEPLSPSLAAALRPRVGRLWNIYGPTETTIWSTAHLVTNADQAVVPVGFPLPDTTVRLLDEQLRPAAPGERGEVWIGGGGVTSGYAGLPELTAERFTADPFEPGGRLYRTGDLGHLDATGALVLVGRADHQVKIRGHRVEPGEIESRLAEDSAVAEAVVSARQDGDDQRLVAYLRPRRGHVLDEARIRAHAADRLPRHMLPAAYVTVDCWPRTPNGKIDRRALPEPPARLASPRDADGEPAETAPLTGGGPRADAVSRAGAPPLDDVGSLDEVAAALAGVWGDLLALAPTDAETDFFALGGTSLDVMRMVKSISTRFGVRLSAVQLMREPTLSAHAELVRTALTAADAARPQP